MIFAPQDAIVLDRVSKTFANAKQQSLRETSLTIRKGELITILGSSGCGKTTLLRMLNRLIKPTSGKIYIHGEDISQIQPAQLRRGIGYAIQQVGLFPHQTVADNIATVPKLLGWDKARIQQRVTELLNLVSLSDYGNRYPRQLSGGQQQRIGLARALAAEPELLLMDEPFGAIDAITRTHLQDELMAIQKKLGTTVIFVTHDVSEALKLGNRVIVINQGQILQFDTPQNILTHPANDFVASLIGTHDFYRQLEFIRAGDFMQLDVSTSNAPIVTADQTLQEVLSLILASGSDLVNVVQDNETRGEITLDALRQLSRQHLDSPVEVHP